MATALKEIDAGMVSEPSLLEATGIAVGILDDVLAAATAAVRAQTIEEGRISSRLLDAHQFAAHGLAWLKVYTEALREMRHWAERLHSAGKMHALETALLESAFGEYLARIKGGIPMSQSEFVRLNDLGLNSETVRLLDHPAIASLIARGTASDLKMDIAEALKAGNFGEWGLDDETLEMIREQFHRFADEEVAPHAHGWHLRDELIPMEVINKLADLGVFGLTIPEEFGGLGMGKVAMCIVTEELSRGYIGVGSLSTRSEIAGELIICGGTDAQKAEFLPRLASGETIPTAVFTEPDTGSDLASLKTRAVLENGTWRVQGAKNWITHAARADLMTVLVRTNPDEKGYRGLSMLLAEKPRGTEAEPFPVDGLEGSEIEVLGYRGMKEYALGFDGFAVPEENLLGGAEGQGFKQLMATFEGARIQTAARAVGVAQNAMEVGLAYALDRKQFGKPIAEFPRVAIKLANMAVEIMVARQLTLFAARTKDAGRRSDLEAGLAKLLGAQIAWSCADNALQIHGGNGYAFEYQTSRLLCDSRILNIFEGAAEIQAHVIARRLMAE